MDTSPPRRRGPRWILIRLTVAGTVLTLGLCAAEVLLRRSGPFNQVFDERNTLCGYDPELGWFPVAGSHKPFTANRTVECAHNSRGFRDPEPGPKTKPRLVFVGDSFTWGYDVEEEERFSNVLGKRVADWEVLNFGVSGYGTDQEYLLLQREFDAYLPDLVVLVWCEANDADDNTTNVRYGGFYKPYFTVEQGRLELHGVPVPQGLRYFFARHPRLSRSALVRTAAGIWFQQSLPPEVHVDDPSEALIVAMKEFVESRHARFAVGATHDAPRLSSVCARHGIPYLSLENPHVYPDCGNHWTPEGHAIVADRLEKFLRERDLLKASPQNR